MSTLLRVHQGRLSGSHVGMQHTPHITFMRWPVSACPLRVQRATRCCRAKSKDALRQSFDSEDELDNDLAQELRAVADPERLKRLAQHFELAWKISTRPGSPQTCDCCKGCKEEECQWCHGTGYLMVGSQVYPSTPTHTNNCPVCKGTGYLKCERCRGTGFRANWLPVDTNLLP